MNPAANIPFTVYSFPQEIACLTLTLITLMPPYHSENLKLAFRLPTVSWWHAQLDVLWFWLGERKYDHNIIDCFNGTMHIDKISCKCIAEL